MYYRGTTNDTEARQGGRVKRIDSHPTKVIRRHPVRLLTRYEERIFKGQNVKILQVNMTSHYMGRAAK